MLDLSHLRGKNDFMQSIVDDFYFQGLQLFKSFTSDTQLWTIFASKYFQERHGDTVSYALRDVRSPMDMILTALMCMPAVGHGWLMI